MPPMNGLLFGRRLKLGLALLLFAGACQQVEPSPSQNPIDAGAWPPVGLELTLPQRYHHWEKAFADDWRNVYELMDQWAERWPAENEGEQALKMTITASPLEANFVAHRAGLPGDAKVPRTHPSRRLALISLPRDDRLLADRKYPPRTFTETVRHEMVHLLACDRPGLASAPAWFHEGLAEALVPIHPKPFPDVTTSAMGSSWMEPLLARMTGGADFPLQAVLADAPAEVRYAAWASLVMQLLNQSDSLTPWELPQANPTLAEFLDSVPRRYGQRTAYPIPRGREADFEFGGKTLLMASLPQQAVVVEAGWWNGQQPLHFSMRVGRTGAALAGVVLRSQAQPEQVVRVRMNTFAAMGASLESVQGTQPRAMQSRPRGKPTASWRDYELRLEQKGDESILRLSSDDYRRSFPPEFKPPYRLDFYVIDGAAEVSSQQQLLPPESGDRPRF